jgi:PPOX class probable F420-dependent enzyme
VDRKTEARLKKELVIWLVTAGEEGRPQAVPVWFLWEDDSVLIFSAPGVKERHVRENPHVELHLNTDDVGDAVVRASGEARIDRRQRPAHEVPAYVRKYGAQIKGLGWTPEEFSRRYPHPIRVRKLKFH